MEHWLIGAGRCYNGKHYFESKLQQGLGNSNSSWQIYFITTLSFELIILAFHE